MIIVWGIPGDGPVHTVCEGLTREGDDWFLLDQSSASRSQICVAEDDASDGWLILDDDRIELSTINSVYPRPYESGRVLRAAGVTDAESIRHAAEFDGAMLLWLEQTRARVVNRPSAMASNGSKPLQSALIAEAGFDIPATLLTTDVGAASAFLDRHGKVIYKSISGVRSRVGLLNAATLERIDVAACAIQLQEYVDGTDFRVHVVGEEVFACSIECEAVDYRHPMSDQAEPRIRRCELPGEMAARCVDLTNHLGLSFAGIDLRHAVDDRWVCFEANPSPGYTFYEQATGAPITQALISLLRCVK